MIIIKLNVFFCDYTMMLLTAKSVSDQLVPNCRNWILDIFLG